MNNATFSTVESLLCHFTEPAEELKTVLKSIQGPLVVLGAGGKMGPTLCVLVKRTLESMEVHWPVIAVSRFSSKHQKKWLESQGVQTHVADLLDQGACALLPDAAAVIYLVGLKFGTTENPELTWAVNTLIPTWVCQRYAGKRMVALSTGNVYPMSHIQRGGSLETDSLTPSGEYANAAVARERLLGYGASVHGIRMSILRLNYALDLRYGVIVDIAKQVLEDQAVDLSLGYFNAIWQRDANISIIRSLDLTGSVPTTWNLTGDLTLSVRDVAEEIARHAGKKCKFVGVESEEALLSNASHIWERIPTILTPISQVIAWTVGWLTSKGPTYDKPTHFQVQDGKY
jgi:nucleoside-diphosphate-sugar epimerase